MGNKQRKITVVVENPEGIEKASEKFIELMYKFYVESKAMEG